MKKKLRILKKYLENNLSPQYHTVYMKMKFASCFLYCYIIDRVSVSETIYHKLTCLHFYVPTFTFEQTLGDNRLNIYQKTIQINASQSLVMQMVNVVFPHEYLVWILAGGCGVPAVNVLAVNCWQWHSGHYFHQSFFLSPLPFFSCFSPEKVLRRLLAKLQW